MAPFLRFLDEATVLDVVAEAGRILEKIGVLVEHDEGREILAGAGARPGPDGRVRIGGDVLDRALAGVRSEIVLYHRDGERSIRAGGDAVGFNPGSAATKVLDRGSKAPRPATSADCVRFAALADRLPQLALQSTCVVPSDLPAGVADRHRLGAALLACGKPVVTGTFTEASFAAMREMLVCIRGSDAALREKPLAIFDCCPTAPLAWSDLTCGALIACARAGIPATIVSVPMTGATSPVTLLGALAQHTAESLAGIAIHQLAAPGAPLLHGACAAAFDMRQGIGAMGAAEAMLINAGAAQIGKHLGLPTQAYMALSDAKLPDYQAGLESGLGALVAALSGINIVSGPGMLDSAGCQSLEKLVLDSEACGAALRAARGLARREESLALEAIAAAMPEGRFLSSRHTRRWHREEIHVPGRAIDRQIGEAWLAAGGSDSAGRACEEVDRLLASEGTPPPDETIEAELRRLMRA